MVCLFHDFCVLSVPATVLLQLPALQGPQTQRSAIVCLTWLLRLCYLSEPISAPQSLAHAAPATLTVPQTHQGTARYLEGSLLHLLQAFTPMLSFQRISSGTFYLKLQFLTLNARFVFVLAHIAIAHNILIINFLFMLLVCYLYINLLSIFFLQSIR